MKQAKQELTWGELVMITDEAHKCYGRVGQYEGVISEDLDALRVRFPGGVIVARRAQLCAVAHPVCAHRRIKAKGLRAPRHLNVPAPACYAKDYGPTTDEVAAEAFTQGLCDGVTGEEFSALTYHMLRTQRDERERTAPRLCRASEILKRRETANDRRWLRTRKGLRQQARIAKATA